VIVQHVLISGFQQTIASGPSGGSGGNGVVELWAKMRTYASKRTTVNIWTWDSNWKDVAALMRMVAGPAEQPRLFVYAYSWGAGWGFVQLAKHLREHGLQVEHAILADPVYRSPWLPTWLPANPLSLTRFPTIDIPRNVRKVSWTYQRRNRPWGHTPVADRPKLTHIEPGVQCPGPHEAMDNDPQWHRMCLDNAQAVHGASEVAA
jgi:hypothetical protein